VGVKRRVLEGLMLVAEPSTQLTQKAGKGAAHQQLVVAGILWAAG
jgi:hypothetical protein